MSITIFVPVWRRSRALFDEERRLQQYCLSDNSKWTAHIKRSYSSPTAISLVNNTTLSPRFFSALVLLLNLKKLLEIFGDRNDFAFAGIEQVSDNEETPRHYVIQLWPINQALSSQADSVVGMAQVIRYKTYENSFIFVLDKSFVKPLVQTTS